MVGWIWLARIGLVGWVPWHTFSARLRCRHPAESSAHRASTSNEGDIHNINQKQRSAWKRQHAQTHAHTYARTHARTHGNKRVPRRFCATTSAAEATTLVAERRHAAAGVARENPSGIAYRAPVGLAGSCNTKQQRGRSVDRSVDPSIGRGASGGSRVSWMVGVSVN